ncbi:MAG: RNA 2',3'-cyclic phosphodiesterase [Candidatus Nanohaloarchaeota archaeon QJJ-9]|nr:RNA 2',3'-cyclic phosphodiesterase [Candidatus Nanohaloarchaeota archaeon QJJ-9]
MGKRCFISLDISDEEVRESLEKEQEKLSEWGNNSLTNPENFHITVNFIGEIDEKEISQITASLNSLEAEKFGVKVKGLGAFPNNDYIKVVWAGVHDKDAKTEKIAGKVRSKIPEKHVQENDFHPHITLMRLKNIGYEEKQKLQEYLEKKGEKEIGKVQIDEIKMKESKLTEKGAKHKTIYKKTLNEN